jgi:hypothetical protein
LLVYFGKLLNESKIDANDWPQHFPSRSLEGQIQRRLNYVMSKEGNNAMRKEDDEWSANHESKKKKLKNGK